jgi:hypothetical protein
MFASKGILEHLARGAVGIGSLIGAVYLAPAYPWLPLVALPVAIFALRGCPTCWTIGLVETIAAKAQGRAATGACTDGSCALRPPSARG